MDCDEHIDVLLYNVAQPIFKRKAVSFDKTFFNASGEGNGRRKREEQGIPEPEVPPGQTIATASEYLLCAGLQSHYIEYCSNPLAFRQKFKLHALILTPSFRKSFPCFEHSHCLQQQ